MPNDLRIRNGTSQSFTLNLVERYEPPRPSAIATLSRNVTGLVSSNSTSIEKHFENEASNISIPAFSTVKTNVRPIGFGSEDVLRLTLETEGLQYSIDIATSAPHGQDLMPIFDKETVQRFTGIYTRTEALLAIFPSSDLADWMAHLSDDLPLSALSIPGTHNSPTYYRALPSVRCQSVSILQQLKNGVRFLDIRVQPVSPIREDLILVHGVFPISLTGSRYFRPLLDELHAFLAAHPAETLILSLKREGIGGLNDAHLSSILATHYKDDFVLAQNVPRLGSVRGKIILLSRFALSPSIKIDQGLPAPHWPFNTPSHATPILSVQDYCEVLSPPQIDTKIEHVRAHLAACGQRRHHPRSGDDRLWLSFLSASNFWHPGCWPDRIARILNPNVVQYLCCEHGLDETADGSAGVVVCDWVGEGGDWDLVRCIVGMNARLATRWPRQSS